MLGIDAGLAPLPAEETRLAFLSHYAAASEARLARLREQPEAWFEETTRVEAIRARLESGPRAPSAV